MLFPLSFFHGCTSALTDIILPVVLLGTGIFLTIRLRFIQISAIGEGFRNMFSSLKKNQDGISPFAALATSLAAQLGTGNIAGAGAAIIAGGPGAVFWMWISAFFGMATSYCEAFLGQKTKRLLHDGSFAGSAVYYIKETFSGKTGKILSVLFSFFSTIALGFTGIAVQSDSICVSAEETFGIASIFTGIIITAAALLILIKGTSAVAKLSEKTIPLMALLYTAVCILVIIKNIKFLPEALYSVIAGAFTPSAVSGALSGITVKKVIAQGIKRGLFTNEAGMGSSPASHGLCDAPSPHYQGTLGITGVFIDTFFMLSLTALAIITVFCKNGFPAERNLSGPSAVISAFADLTGEKAASVFTSLSILLFAFASILGWHISGKASCIYLFGERSERIYLISSLMFILAGALLPSDTIWTLTDIFNAFMVLTNVPALIIQAQKGNIGPCTALQHRKISPQQKPHNIYL